MASIPSTDDDAEKRRLNFLLEEGLELLAVFQMISDADTRKTIMNTVRQAAAIEGARLPTAKAGLSNGQGASGERS